MKNGIINELKFASKKKKNAVLGYVYCDYLLDMFEEIEFHKNNERIAIDCQNKLNEEIERLNNIINEFEKLLKEERARTKYAHDVERFTAYDYMLKRLQELKGSDEE